MQEAMAAGVEIDRTDEVYRAEDAHAWLELTAGTQRLPALPPRPPSA